MGSEVTLEHDYADIAAMLETTPANCRQLLHRAKERIAEKRPRFRAATAARRPLVDRFVRALRNGDAAEFTSVLAADVGFWSDGGGKVLAARRPIHGRDAVINLLIGFRRAAPAAGVDLAGVSLDVADVNGDPAMLLRVAGKLDSVYTFTIEDQGISAIRVVRNPDKLQFLERQLASL